MNKHQGLFESIKINAAKLKNEKYFITNKPKNPNQKFKRLFSGKKELFTLSDMRNDLGLEIKQLN